MKNYNRLRELVYGIIYGDNILAIGKPLSLQDIILAISLETGECYFIDSFGFVYVFINKFKDNNNIEVKKTNIEIDLTKPMQNQEEEVYTNLINLLK